MINTQNVLDRLDEAIRSAVSYEEFYMEKSLIELYNVLHGNFVNEYPIVWAEKLMAIFQGRDSNLELVLECPSNRGKADTLEEFLLDVYVYISENGTTLNDWQSTIMSIPVCDDLGLNLVLVDLLRALHGLVSIDEDERINEFDNSEITESTYSCLQCGTPSRTFTCADCWYRVIQIPGTPTKTEQEKRVIDLGLKLCEECLIPIKPGENCDHGKLS